MTLTQSRGWQLTLTHPDTDRSINPDVLDDPEFLPSLNGLVEARIPVRRSQDLLDWPDGTTVSLSLNGTEQALDEVIDFEQESNRTIVVAEGGIELDNRVRTEYREERRHIAAEEIIVNETPYEADVDTPEFNKQEDVVLQEAGTTQEFTDLTDISSETPLTIDDGVIKLEQTAFIDEAETLSNDTISDENYSDGSAAEFEDTASDDVEFTFNLEYDVDAEDAEILLRCEENDSDSDLLYNLLFDGTTIQSQFSPFSGLEWNTYTLSNEFDTIESGSHTIRLEVDSGTASPGDALDLIGFADRQYDITLDNEVNEPDGYLDGPQKYPDAVDVVFDDATTPFVITETTGEITIDDTSGDQAVAISADRGDSYTEETNSDTVTASDLETPQVRLRVTLSRWEPDGPRDQTPRLGYASQEVDDIEITVDLQTENLLIDQTFDDSVSSVLNEIAGDEYVWSYRLKDGEPTVAWTQPGQRTSDNDPDIDADVTVSKRLKTWDAVTIKGSSQSALGEEFDGSTSFVELDRDNIVPGSEAVTDTSDGTQFTRAEDYEMEYNPGEIRILDSGDMSSGTTYEIDYRYEVEGQFPIDFDGDGRELVETISGVVSDRQATQLANTILNIDPAVSETSFSADVVLPRGGALFDPLEALSLDQLELPSDVGPLEVREPPQTTPEGISLQLGSRRPLDEALSSLSNQLKSVSRRS